MKRLSLWLQVGALAAWTVVVALNLWNAQNIENLRKQVERNDRIIRELQKVKH
jgi:hypothetical protein